MSLASRLNRLRGQPAAVTQPRPAQPWPTAGVRHDGLMQALQAESQVEGVLLRSRELALPDRCDGPHSGLNRLPEVHDLADVDWVYLDTETTGLSGGVGNLAFLVGVARYRNGQCLQLRQFTLASFAAEAAMLRMLDDWIGERAVLVSYNGKSFDLPLLVSRYRMHRLDTRLGDRRQLDLMYTVRRAYRRHWPDCRLQTAERQLLQLQRVDDLPGAEAPAAWQAWLCQRAVEPLRRVLEHNFQDVVSLVLLHQRLLRDYNGEPSSRLDHAAVSRAWAKSGCAWMACQVLESAGEGLDEAGRLQLADLYRRAGFWSRAEAVWLELQARGSQAAALALSKYYEHRKRDYRRAIGYAEQGPDAQRQKRRARLQRKLGRNLQLSLIGEDDEIAGAV